MKGRLKLILVGLAVFLCTLFLSNWLCCRKIAKCNEVCSKIEHDAYTTYRDCIKPHLPIYNQRIRQCMGRPIQEREACLAEVETWFEGRTRACEEALTTAEEEVVKCRRKCGCRILF